jgi:hypothetical protein
MDAFTPGGALARLPGATIVEPRRGSFFGKGGSGKGPSLYFDPGAPRTGTENLNENAK